MQNHYLNVKYNVGYYLCLTHLPFSSLLFFPFCLNGELTAVASSRACLVAAGFRCHVLGYHAHSGIWVCARLWHCTACSCEALSEVVSGQAASSMAEPLLITGHFLYQVLPDMVEEIHMHGSYGHCGHGLRTIGWIALDLCWACRIISQTKGHCIKKLHFQCKLIFFSFWANSSGDSQCSHIYSLGHTCFWRSCESVLQIVGKWIFTAVLLLHLLLVAHQLIHWTIPLASPYPGKGWVSMKWITICLGSHSLLQSVWVWQQPGATCSIPVPATDSISSNSSLLSLSQVLLLWEGD